MSGIDFALVDGDGNVDWKKARAAGVDFAYLNATPGNSVWDQAFAANEAGVEVGPYVFPTIRKGIFPALQMQKAWESIQHEYYVPGDLPVCLDVELPRGIAGTGMSRAEICDWLITAYHELQRLAGHAPMLYSSVRVLDTNDTDTLNGGLNSLAGIAPLWLARYDGRDETVAPKAWGAGNYWIHQLAGDRKNYAGIRQVDVDSWHYARKGETGARATWIQQKLGVLDCNYPSHDPATLFDEHTDLDVRALQAQHGLVSDGIIGPRTFAYLAKL